VATAQTAVTDSISIVRNTIAAPIEVAASAGDTVPTQSSSTVTRASLADAAISSTAAAFEAAAAADSSVGHTALTQEEVEAAMRDAMQERTTLIAAARKVRAIRVAFSTSLVSSAERHSRSA
jgi:hypothetical protein